MYPAKKKKSHKLKEFWHKHHKSKRGERSRSTSPPGAYSTTVNGGTLSNNPNAHPDLISFYSPPLNQGLAFNTNFSADYERYMNTRKMNMQRIKELQATRRTRGRELSTLEREILDIADLETAYNNAFASYGQPAQSNVPAMPTYVSTPAYIYDYANNQVQFPISQDQKYLTAPVTATSSQKLSPRTELERFRAAFVSSSTSSSSSSSSTRSTPASTFHSQPNQYHPYFDQQHERTPSRLRSSSEFSYTRPQITDFSFSKDFSAIAELDAAVAATRLSSSHELAQSSPATFPPYYHSDDYDEYDEPTVVITEPMQYKLEPQLEEPESYEPAHSSDLKSSLPIPPPSLSVCPKLTNSQGNFPSPPLSLIPSAEASPSPFAFPLPPPPPPVDELDFTKSPFLPPRSHDVALDIQQDTKEADVVKEDDIAEVPYAPLEELVKTEALEEIPEPLEAIPEPLEDVSEPQPLQVYSYEECTYEPAEEPRDICEAEESYDAVFDIRDAHGDIPLTREVISTSHDEVVEDEALHTTSVTNTKTTDADATTVCSIINSTTSTPTGTVSTISTATTTTSTTAIPTTPTDSHTPQRTSVATVSTVTRTVDNETGHVDNVTFTTTTISHPSSPSHPNSHTYNTMEHEEGFLTQANELPVGRSSLLEQIRQGRALRKVCSEPSNLHYHPAPSHAHSHSHSHDHSHHSHPAALTSTLTSALASRRAQISDDDDESEEEEEAGWW